MTRDEFQAMLSSTKARYQSTEDPERPAAGDVVTVSRETEGEFAVWRLEGETWLRCGMIAVDDDARAWNASQMERFWNTRAGSSLELGCLPVKPRSLDGEPITRSELAGPVESIMRVVHLVWVELQTGPPRLPAPVVRRRRPADAGSDRRPAQADDGPQDQAWPCEGAQLHGRRRPAARAEPCAGRDRPRSGPVDPRYDLCVYVGEAHLLRRICVIAVRILVRRRAYSPWCCGQESRVGNRLAALAATDRAHHREDPHVQATVERRSGPDDCGVRSLALPGRDRRYRCVDHAR